MIDPDREKYDYTGPEVMSVNLFRRLAILENNKECPIVALFNDEEDEIDDPKEAKFFIVKVADDCWLCESVDDYDWGSRSMLH